MKDSRIEWCDHTFNPWWGCEKVSPGCAHCYADTFAKRTGHEVWGSGAPRRFFGDKHWNEPLKWNADAESKGEPQYVFCASMADVFEDREDLIPHRERLFDLIDDTRSLTWLLLTKRPENIAPIMARMSKGSFGSAWNFRDHMPNVWLGVTAEDQQRADERTAILRTIRARVHFLSCEPLLAPLHVGALRGIDWVICGGESGPGARAMHPEWARSMRDQCAAAGVPFLFKQWGEWAPMFAGAAIDVDGKRVLEKGMFTGHYKAGKHKAGRLLDGVEHNGFPA